MMGEYDCTVLAVLGLVACLNRELANKAKPAVGYLWHVSTMLSPQWLLDYDSEEEKHTAYKRVAI